MQEVEETIEGFYFEDEDAARQAMKEYMYIEKMKDRVAALKPEELKDFYEKLLDKQIFSSQVGYTYLYEMRSTLVEAYHFQPEELSNIVISDVSRIQESTHTGTEKSKTVQEQEILSLKRTRTLLGVSVVLLIVVIIAFFIILATNQNIGYINTENKIVDKYSGWQEQLDAKEQELDIREQELDEREKKLNGAGNFDESIDVDKETSGDVQEAGDDASDLD